MNEICQPCFTVTLISEHIMVKVLNLIRGGSDS